MFSFVVLILLLLSFPVCAQESFPAAPDDGDIFSLSETPSSSWRDFSPQTEFIPIAPMQKFSGLTKAEILSKRLSAVKSSPVFGDVSDYRPSDGVFQIEDGLPWIGAYEITCFGVDKTRNIGDGDSRESVGILNPEMLYGIVMGTFAFHDKTGCSEADYLIPHKLEYDRRSNTVSAYIDYSAFYRKNKTFYGIILEDANAADLGYSYAFADETRNIRFKNGRNFSTETTATSGFFHKGHSCEAASGCNNYSPYESRYHLYLTGLPALLHIKLWKKRPADPVEPADINYEIVFQ